MMKTVVMRGILFHHGDTENTEKTRRKQFLSSVLPPFSPCLRGEGHFSFQIQRLLTDFVDFGFRGQGQFGDGET